MFPRLIVPVYRIALVLAVLHAAAATEPASSLIPVLILDGRNNHDWRATTDALRSTLVQSGRFAVTVERAPEYAGPPAVREPAGGDADFKDAKARSDALALPYQAALDVRWQQWRPGFKAFAAVILNYNGPAWPQPMRDDFVAFVKSGGGVYVIHAANNGFRDWPEFNAMIGLGWRPGGFGTCLAVDPESGRGVACCGDKATGHGRLHPFLVTARLPQHAVFTGMPNSWLHGSDELYHHQRGPAENLTILASAYSDPAHHGSGQHEPVLWEVAYGRGRVLVTSLGHQWAGQQHHDGLYCTGFQALVTRGTEYLATGTVTLPLPDNFPTATTTSVIPPSAVIWSGKKSETASTNVWHLKKQMNEAAVLTPDEERQSFTLPPGFVAELVASEPMVEEPVLAVWDANGALYVAEMSSYMQDAQGSGTKTLRNGRIKRLVDTNGDGRMDRVTVFADGLNLPRMVLPLDDRIAVVETDSSTVWSFRDRDGDGIAEDKTVLFQGKSGDPAKSVEHQDSGLDWNVDNWIYVSYGRERYRFTDGAWRAEPMHGIWAQWGVTHDDVGRVFYSENSQPALGFQLPRAYWSHLERRAGIKPPAGDPLSLGLAWDMSFLQARNLCARDDRGGQAPARKTFTAACGQSVFRGSALPPGTRGDYFFCDPTIHVVRQSDVSNRNGRIRFDSTWGSEEFLSSPDILFRPVNTASGPDGCLTVVDMYRGIIQDAPWLDEKARAFVTTSGLSAVRQRGRIWRIRHQDHTPVASPSMLREETPQLLRHLASPDGWWRDTAQRLLILRDDRGIVVPALKDMARYHADPLARMHALWTLEGMMGLDEPLLQACWRDADARVRSAAVRMSEPWFKRNDMVMLQAIARRAVDERDPEVSRQIILSLGYAQGPDIIPVVDSLVERHMTHEGVCLAAAVVLWRKPSPLVQRIATGDALLAISDPAARAQAVAMWTNALGQWQRGLQLPPDLPKERRDLITKGETLYFQNCVSCHGADGRGVLVPGSAMPLAPALALSARVRGPASGMVPVLLHGLLGPIEGTAYQGAFMPPVSAFGITRDDRLAEIVSYVRYAWGNAGSSVTADDIKTMRKQHAERQSPWTDADLKLHAAEMPVQP